MKYLDNVGAMSDARLLAIAGSIQGKSAYDIEMAAVKAEMIERIKSSSLETEKGKNRMLFFKRFLSE